MATGGGKEKRGVGGVKSGTGRSQEELPGGHTHQVRAVTSKTKHTIKREVRKKEEKKERDKKNGHRAHERRNSQISG